MKRRSLLFDIDIPTGVEVGVGRVLVAEPFLREEFFNHSVVLIVDYAPSESVMGVVLNNPSEHKLQDLLDGVTVDEPIPVYTGGPIGSDSLYFLHTLGDIIPDAREIAPGIWLGGNFEELFKVINEGYEIEGSVRFFLGYSGWSPGQLEEEIGRSVWAVAEAPQGGELLKGDGTALWHESVRRLGEKFRGWIYHPKNPQAN